MISLDNGFQEAVALVADAADSARRLCRVFGFRQLWQGSPSLECMELMGIDPAWRAEEVLVGDPAQGRGYMRLISLPGRTDGLLRDGAQTWDTGGIFDVNIRCLRSIEEQYSAMTQAGFVAHAPVTQWQFGPLDVKEVVLRDGDGLCIAMMQRMSPPLPGFERVAGPVSYIFNSTQIVADFDAARSFYVDVLGWQPVQETEWAHEDGRNCLGLPLDVAKTCQMRVGIYHPRGVTEGSVEIIGFGVEGLDFSQSAPPLRGLAALRFPMSDPQQFLDRAAKGGCHVLPLRETVLGPYGEVELGAAVTPWGARLEAFRPLWSLND